MDQVITQILNILVEPPGNLIYSTIIIFSIMMALQSAVVQQGKISGQAHRRLVVGLILVLLCHLTVFIASALGWQRIIDYQWIMPILDRSMSWVSISLLFWLWIFPTKNSVGDTLSSGLCVFGLIYLFSGLLYWAQLAGILHFNQTALDFSWAAGLGLLAITAMVILTIQKPVLWNIGVGFFLMIGIGTIGHLVWSNPNSDISSVFRLAQICVYPLVPILSQRQILQTAVIEQPVVQRLESAAGKPNAFANSASVAAWLRLVKIQDLPALGTLITEVVSRSLRADIVLFLTREDLTGPLTISGGFNLFHEKRIEKADLDQTQTPQLSAALQRKNILHLPYKNANSPAEYDSLGHLLGLKEIGSLLLVPLEIKSYIGSGLLLLSPYSKHEWNKEDQNFLQSISADIENAFAIARQHRDAILENKAMRAEIENLKHNLLQPGDFQGSDSTGKIFQHDEIHSDSSILWTGFNTRSSNTQEIILKLESENASLREALQDFSANQNFNQPAPKTTQLNPALKRSLEETAQGIRQSISSIHGFTDLLINESTGTLGVLQLKILRRLQNTSDQLSTLLDGFIYQATTNNLNSGLTVNTSDLGEVLDDVLNKMSSLLKDKNIALEMDIPDDLEHIYLERDVLSQIIFQLLQNTLQITPDEKDLKMRAHLEQNEGGNNYINFQVTENNGSFSQKEASIDEYTLIWTEPSAISKNGEPWAGFSAAQTLVEAHGGRLWVKTRSGESLSFKLLSTNHSHVFRRNLIL